MPEKVTIAYRGAKYEIGLGKRYYGIWVTGAPGSDPIDRWPETRDGWTQAWTRFTMIETPGTISEVGKPRAGLKLPVRTSAGARDRAKPARATVAAGLIGAGVLLGLIGLFPGYVEPQSLASSPSQLVPHLIYLIAWAASGAAIALGARRSAAPRFEVLRTGALLGSGLSAVTFGLFFTDLGQVISGGSNLLGAGLVLSLLGWLACATGSVLALAARPRAAAPVTQSVQTQPVQTQPWYAAPSPAQSSQPPQPGQPQANSLQAGEPFTAEQSPARPSPVGPSFAWASPAPSTPASAGHPSGRAAASGPAKPRMADAGPLALILLAAIGAVVAFAPSWDSYTLTQPSTGATQTITLGNAFAVPGVMIAGNVAVMVAAIAMAVLAALWRPVRHGAVLLAAATVPLAAQAISALIGVSEPATPAQFGISPAAGVSITSGVTPIFWVYCVFVISLVVSSAWMLTAPRYPAMPAVPQSPAPSPVHVHAVQDAARKDGDSDDDDAEDDAESTYA